MLWPYRVYSNRFQLSSLREDSQYMRDRVRHIIYHNYAPENISNGSRLWFDSQKQSFIHKNISIYVCMYVCMYVCIYKDMTLINFTSLLFQ